MDWIMCMGARRVLLQVIDGHLLIATSSLRQMSSPSNSVLLCLTVFGGVPTNVSDVLSSR
jgi:hypothetical protein